MIYYIADCHFYHGALNTKMDKRGFESAEDMNEYMIEKWNSKVGKTDTVVILGDLSLGTVEETNNLINRLKGKLCLRVEFYSKGDNMSEEMEKDLELDSANTVSEEVLSDASENQEATTEAGNASANENAHWYVVHTYSGYENKVKANLEKTIENRHLENQILEVRVPLQDVVEVKNGARKNVQRKMFPGYVLVNMDMNDETWYVVRNTRGVTGFVGPGSKPVPLTDAEIKPLGIKTDTISVDFGVGDEIAVIAGVWKDTAGVVQRMDFGKQTATINVDLFGRETPVEISFAEVRKIDS